MKLRPRLQEEPAEELVMISLYVVFLQMISFIVLRIMYMYSAGKAWNTVFLYREAATR